MAHFALQLIWEGLTQWQMFPRFPEPKISSSNSIFSLNPIYLVLGGYKAREATMRHVEAGNGIFGNTGINSSHFVLFYCLLCYIPDKFD